MKYSTSALILTFSVSWAFVSCNNPNPEHSQQQNTSPQTEQQQAPAKEQTPQAPSPQEVSMQAPAKSIPSFTFYHVKSGISFTQDELSEDKNTVFIFFDPGCGFCQEEAAALSDNYDKLQDIDMYFVSLNNPALMAEYLETYGPELEDKENVKMLYDKNQEFIHKIHVPERFPANYVYGKDGQLKTYWEGEKSIHEIIEAYTN
ncbi:MAG TPA: redoxin domain-containing protein [Sphingobacterium sp.]|nr:redoxin domain-containing protein [Sphingobacterium sp.]